MTIKTHKIKAHNIDSETGIAKNNLVIIDTIFVKKDGAIVDKAGASDTIAWVSITTWVFASNNESKDKKEVNFYPKNLDITYEISIKGGEVVKADEGKKFNLSDEKTVDGTNKEWTQLFLVEFLSAKRWVFRLI